MFDFMTPEIGFASLISLFIVGAIGSLFFRNNDKLANRWQSFFAITGSLTGIFFSISQLISGKILAFAFAIPGFPLLSLSLYIDAISAFFIFIISLIALMCSIYGIDYIKHYYGKYDLGALGFFFNAFIVGIILVVSASNAIFFLIAWETMSFASYFLVIYDHHDKENVKAGFLYLIMTQVGTVFIMGAFLLMYKYTGSFDFRTIQANAGLIPVLAKNLIFVFALTGFGIKAGIIPLHIWLPAAHPAAPSHVSAIMSGVMIKSGIFMMIRVFLDLIQPAPTWWGLTIITIGAISSLLGVLYALTEHDIKRLLAYHSIENIGIILLGVGSALTFSSLNMPGLALISLVAALFHTLNHATFKSLLFLSAGSVINQTHTRNMEEFGGLIKFMPQTALFFLIGSMAISALPPFNGFFSEWLTYQALFQGIAVLSPIGKGIFMLAAGSLAFTGGLALACFVKAFGVTFLARPRSEEVEHAKESSFLMRLGMGTLATLSLLFGIFSGYLITAMENIGKSLAVFKNMPAITEASTGQGLVLKNNFSSVSGFAFFVLFLIVMALVYYVTKHLIYKEQKIVTGTTWDCGCDLGPRMEITATGFSRSIILIFKKILQPSIEHEIEYVTTDNPYTPKSKTVILGINDIHYSYIYQPLQAIIKKSSSYVKKIQSGNVNTYIAYIFIALVVTLFLAL